MLDIVVWALLFFLILQFLRFFPYMIRFQNSKYKEESGVSLLKFLFNKGNFGEGLIFFELEKIKIYSKILTNVYLPTEDGTTELDLVYIAQSGIYVLESKNYSGWIFGDEKYKNWTSVIYKNKYKFYNPIWQNKKHVKYIKLALGDVHTKSIIVFSNRCEFKKLNVGNNVVIQRRRLRKVISGDLNDQIYTNEQIDEFYNRLKTYSNQSQEVKQQHVKNISNRMNN